MRESLSAALHGLKAQQVHSPGQRPGYHVPHSLRPVRAKVKANHSPILLPLQGVGVYTLIPRALPWAVDWLPFQGAPVRALFVYDVRMLRRYVVWFKIAQRFFLGFEHPTFQGVPVRALFVYDICLMVDVLYIICVHNLREGYSSICSTSTFWCMKSAALSRNLAVSSVVR